MLKYVNEAFGCQHDGCFIGKIYNVFASIDNF